LISAGTADIKAAPLSVAENVYIFPLFSWLRIQLHSAGVGSRRLIPSCNFLIATRYQFCKYKGVARLCRNKDGRDFITDGKMEGAGESMVLQSHLRFFNFNEVDRNVRCVTGKRTSGFGTLVMA
jgi:hypothetical protein